MGSSFNNVPWIQRIVSRLFTRHNGYFIAPIRVNGSAIQSIFSQLKYIAGGNLSSTNYATSLSSLVTQKDVQANPYTEKGYKTDK